MKVQWAFEIKYPHDPFTTYYWAFDNVTLGGHAYTAKILKNSFSGMVLRWDIAGNGLVAPNEISFEVSDADLTLYGGVGFSGWKVNVRIFEEYNTTMVESRVWTMICSQSVAEYGKIRFYCHDIVQEMLRGNYPLSIDPKTKWPSNDTSPGDYVVPMILGTGYVPVISVNTGTQRYYPIGQESYYGTLTTYDVLEVQSPHDWDLTSIWTSEEYEFPQTTNNETTLIQAIIADSDGDGVVDAPGLWKSGDTFLPMLCKFTRSDTAELTNPADWIEWFFTEINLEGFELPINETTFATAKSACTYIEFNGGWWQYESREKALSSMLSQFDGFINVSDNIELYQFDKTPVEEFDYVLKDSFRSSKISPSNYDSVNVEWYEEDYPQDVFPGKVLTSIIGSVDKETPSSEVFTARFLSDSVNAQKAAILYYQKKYLQKESVSFSMAWPSVDSRDTLCPGQVVKVNNGIYGGNKNIIITQMTIGKDFKIEIKGVVLSILNDWGDVHPDAVAIVHDDYKPFVWEIADSVIDVINEGGYLNDVHLGFTGKTDNDADYDIVGYHKGGISAGGVLLKIPFIRDLTFAENLGAGTITVEMVPEFDIILKVFKNDDEIGFIEFVAGNITGIINVAETSFTTADTLSIVCDPKSDGWGLLTGNPEFEWVS